MQLPKETELGLFPSLVKCVGASKGKLAHGVVAVLCVLCQHPHECEGLCQHLQHTLATSRRLPSPPIFFFLGSLLGSESNVVHSYAAIAVDRLLAMREPAGGVAGAAAAGRGGPRFQPSDLAPLLQPLLEKLFAAFKFPESGENEYLMRAVMRVIAFVGEPG